MSKSAEKAEKAEKGRKRLLTVVKGRKSKNKIWQIEYVAYFDLVYLYFGLYRQTIWNLLNPVSTFSNFTDLVNIFFEFAQPRLTFSDFFDLLHPLT